MDLFPQLGLLFSLTLFFSFSFWVGRAMDCSGNGITKTIIVDQSGKGNFKLIQDAIDSIKENNDQWVKVHIKAGTYREKVNISKYKPCVFLEGEGKDVTTITYGEYVNQKTWDNATFVSSPPNVIVVGITFENTYRNSEVSKFTEAPAAAIFGDKTAFYKSGFIGFQDTLLDSNGRHYFKYCYIQGEVDFIFGNGQSYYEECLINATQGKSPPGFITAQARGLENDTSGFVFRKGIVFGDGQVKLGRAYGPYSTVIYHGTYFSEVVSPEGWDPWNRIGHESQLTYAEVDCIGPGSNTTNRVKWRKTLTSEDLRKFSLSQFVNQDGWLSKLPITIM